MPVPTRFASLGPSDQWLIRQLQQIVFGRLTFVVQGGSACPSRGFQITRTLKLASGATPAVPQLQRDDFELRSEHLALLRHLRSLPDGTRVMVKVAAGLPTSSIDVEEALQHT